VPESFGENFLVAGGGFEPPTFGLWGLLFIIVPFFIIYFNFSNFILSYFDVFYILFDIDYCELW